MFFSKNIVLKIHNYFILPHTYDFYTGQKPLNIGTIFNLKAQFTYKNAVLERGTLK